MSGSMVPEGNAQHALHAHFSWDSHFIASTHTLLSLYYSLIVGHIMNRKTESETEKKEKKISGMETIQFDYRTLFLLSFYYFASWCLPC